MEANCVCSTINPRDSFMFSLFLLSPFASCDSFAVIVQKVRNLSVFFSQFFLAWNQIGKSLEYNIGPSCPLRQLIWSQDSLNAAQCISSLKNESHLSWSYTTSLLPLGVYKQCEKSFFDNTALQKTDSSDFFFIKDAEKGLWRFILKQDLKKECP